MGLRLIAGTIPATLPPDKEGSQQYMLINEKLAFAMGWKPKEAIGRVIRKDEKTTCLVVGVLKDFTQNSFSDPIQPLAMCLIPPEQASQWVIRARPGHLAEVADQARGNLGQTVSRHPAQYLFPGLKYLPTRCASMASSTRIFLRLCPDHHFYGDNWHVRPGFH